MKRKNVCLVLAAGFLVIGCALSGHAQTTQCSYNFNSGVGNNSISYCVTVNGNIPQIQIPFGQSMVASQGEGYGICDQNAPANYTDYGVSTTGNWGPPVLLSRTTASVKIARTTSDGNWTLTQTINKIASPPSIKIVMAVTNHQAVDDVAYLVRFADGEPPEPANNQYNWLATLNHAVAVPFIFGAEAQYGLELENVGTPQFGYWQGFAQAVSSGPNACAFAFNANTTGNYVNFPGTGSIELAYVGTVHAGKTNTATLLYRGF